MVASVYAVVMEFWEISNSGVTRAVRGGMRASEEWIIIGYKADTEGAG